MSLSAWMSDNEFEWRKRLQPVKLVVETDFSEFEVRTAQKKYGAAARQLLLRGESYEQVIKRFPALTLLVLVGHASLAYDQGKYWESFWSELGIRQDQDFENAIRRNIVKLLDKFTLARFPDIERENNYKYVMMLALHAGIPIHCLGDLVKLINAHITQGRPAYGAAVIEWLEEPGKEYRAEALDVPVRNFLVNGAEFAVDILDRIIEFIQETTTDPDLLNLELDASTTGLPCVLLDELIELLRDAPMQFERKRLVTRGAQRPTISYNVDDDEIILDLPAPEADAVSPWRVSFDGEVREVCSFRKWGGETQSASVAIPGPVREVVLSHPGVASSALSLVVKSDPLLVFDAAGRWIGRRDGLKDCVWAVFPEHLHLFDPRTFERVEARDMGSPAGWRGWRSAFIQLDDITALQLRSNDRTLVGTERWVRKDVRPTFELGEPVIGVFTDDGRRIHGSRPWVMLPPSETDPGPSWNVRVRHLGQADWLVDCNWDAETVKTCVDPFDEADDAQLGLFEIVVTGPLGADARCVVFLAEGLDAGFDTQIRVGEPGGLTQCLGEVFAEGFTVIPQGPLEFGPRRLDLPIQLIKAGLTWKALVRPPHIEIRTGESGSPAAWRMTPDVCDPDDFALDRFVAIRAPGVSSVRFGYVSADGDLLQLDRDPRHRSGDVFETRTQQFADTVRNHPAGRLVATLYTEDDPVDVTVLSAQPRQLASGVELDEDRLRFVDIADVSDLAVYVWSSTAPWLGPEIVSVIDGTAVLPAVLVDAGELRCQLFVDDPWVMIDAPPVPGESAFRVGQLGWREDGTPDQVKLSRYLGTRSKPPVEVGAAPEVWAALTTLYADGKIERFHGLIQLLIRNSRKALECLGDSTIPAGDKMAMLIRSEIVNHNFAAEQTLNDLHSHPWFGCMVELADLPSLHQRRSEVREERAETLAYLRDRGGNPLMDLLRTGKNASAYEACFDENVFAMAAVPSSKVEAKLAEIQQVPRAQLHPESLRIAVYEAFCRRNEWLASGWSANFAQQTSLVVNPIRHKSQLARDAIMTRRDRVRGIDASEHPWILMSVESLTLAVLARLEAHGRIGGQYLNRGLLGDWATMAQLCPTMVANDLLIAEAVVLYERRGDLTGEDA